MIVECMKRWVKSSTSLRAPLHLRKEGESNAQGTLLCSTAFQAAAVTYRLALPWLPIRANVLPVL